MMVVKAMQLLFGGQWSPLQYVSNPDADEDWTENKKQRNLFMSS
jgi:hypothetical protein